MRGTRKGLRLLLALLLLWAAAGYAFYRIDRENDRTGYRLLAELIEWKTRLAQRTPTPRVVIAGGSNAYYSLDPTLMRERLNVPVVNLALPFAAHHYSIALEILEKQVKPGDVVVFSAAAIWNFKVTTMRHAVAFDAYLDRRIDWYSANFSTPLLPWRALPESGPLLLAAAAGFREDSGRSWVQDTDKLGKFTACVDAPVITPEHFNNDAPDPDFVAALKEAATRLKKKNVVLTLSIPWLLVREGDEERWQDYAEAVADEFDGSIRLIASRPETLTYTKQEQFCDSPLHLSKAASRARTFAVADSLRPLIDSR